MNDDLFRAKERLQKGDYTCVLVKGEKTYESTARGVKPLLEWLDDGTDLCGASAADKVVGKAAAFLYVLLGVKAVYAPIVSALAVEVFRAHGIEVFFDEQVEAIRNRANTGYCPMETSVRDINSPEAAVQAIRETLAKLSR